MLKIGISYGTIKEIGKNLDPDWYVSMPSDNLPGGERVLLRDLLTRVVHEEVKSFHTRQSQNKGMLLLTAEQMEEGRTRGRILSGASEIESQKVDLDQATATALLSFEDGLYYVFVDGERQVSLDAEVFLKPNSSVKFARLVALTGVP